MTEKELAPAGIDPNVPSVARMYDYYLGGKDNFASDRAAAEKVMALVPTVREAARDNRGFLIRAVRELVGRGIRQFLDIGAGLPTQQNVHQVALEAAPDSRVVYVDNDPIVLVHARALLARSPQTVVVSGDLREPKAILDDPAVTAHLDFSQPIALLIVAVLHFIPDYDETRRIVDELRRPLVPGSHLVLSHSYGGRISDQVRDAGEAVYSNTQSGSISSRDPEQVTAYFDGLDLLEPGVVPSAAWRPERGRVTPDFSRPSLLAGVGRVP